VSICGSFSKQADRLVLVHSIVFLAYHIFVVYFIVCQSSEVCKYTDIISLLNGLCMYSEKRERLFQLIEFKKISYTFVLLVYLFFDFIGKNFVALSDNSSVCLCIHSDKQCNPHRSMSSESIRIFSYMTLTRNFIYIEKKNKVNSNYLLYVLHPAVATSDSRIIKYAHLFFNNKQHRSITRVMNMDVF
jgi:hypothetical protein